MAVTTPARYLSYRCGASADLWQMLGVELPVLVVARRGLVSVRVGNDLGTVLTGVQCGHTQCGPRRQQPSIACRHDHVVIIELLCRCTAVSYTHLTLPTNREV